MNRPRSHAAPIIRRVRERKYPWIFSTRKYFGACSCEACNKKATQTVEFEASKDEIALSIVYLCDDHEKLTRFGKFDQVFRDMNREIERREKR